MSEQDPYGFPPPGAGAPPPPPEGQPPWPPPPWQQPPGAPGAGGYPPYPNPEEMGGPAWEHRAELGFFRALTTTWREVMFNPSVTFANARRKGSFGDPLLYFIIVIAVGALLGHFLVVATGQYDRMANPEQFKELPQEAQNLILPLIKFYGTPMFKFVVGPIVMLFIYPLFFVLNAFLMSAVYHLCLIIMGGANRDYESTFRAYCYIRSSAQIIYAIPVCGAFIGLPWSVALQIIALKELHQTDTWRAAFAVLLPAFCCCCAAGSIGLMIAFSMAAQMQP